MATADIQQPLHIKIEREIGRGAHSCVKLGRDINTFEPLAVKIINIADHSGRHVFNTELCLLNLIPEHRCVPRLYGHYVKETKGCLVMEYLPFPTLKDLLQDGPLAEDQAIHVLRQMNDALHYMTGRGVAHRDWKPENIIINPDNMALKLIDFGLGTEISGDDARDSSYRGTPVYMAPEVLRKLPDYLVVPAELWSIGIIFLECLTGSQPFEGVKSRRELHARQTTILDEINALPVRAQRILNGLLALRPRERQSMVDLRNLIDELYPMANTAVQGRRSSDRLYTISRAKTFTDLSDFKSTGGSAFSQSPRCPLPPGIADKNSMSRFR